MLRSTNHYTALLVLVAALDGCGSERVPTPAENAKQNLYRTFGTSLGAVKAIRCGGVTKNAGGGDRVICTFRVNPVIEESMSCEVIPHGQCH